MRFQHSSCQGMEQPASLHMFAQPRTLTLRRKPKAVLFCEFYRLLLLTVCRKVLVQNLKTLISPALSFLSDIMLMMMIVVKCRKCRGRRGSPDDRRRKGAVYDQSQCKNFGSCYDKLFNDQSCFIILHQ